MKIYLKSQDEKLKQHLAFLKQEKVMEYDRAQFIDKTSLIELNVRKRLNEIDLGFLFNYDIFPKHILGSLNQWNAENRKMAIGDTIAQQVFIPPIKSFSQKLIFGVRISEIIDLETIKGFAYETLEGHVEKGISLFTLEQHDEKKLIFKIQTYSAPGNILSRILGPVFSVSYQAYCTKAALNHVKNLIQRQALSFTEL